MTPADIERIKRRIEAEQKQGARLFSLKIEDAAWLVASVGGAEPPIGGTA